MQESEEIRRVVDRFLAANRDGDVDAVMARMSEIPHLLAIGTDSGEVWRGHERAVWGRQLEESGGFPFAWGEIDAWEEGTVGWAAMVMSLGGLDGEGPSFEARATLVLHLERGEWRIVQAHFSLPGRANVEVLGMELTISLDQLHETVQHDRPDLSASAAEDGTVTLVFTDVVDSTVIAARVGDYAWMETVRRHHDVIAETVATHGGRVVETQGDGAMLAFGSARRAIACAQEVQVAIGHAFEHASPPIRVRIGIHTGDVLQEEDRFFGTTVNYAARVASHALGGEILVSQLVHDLADGTGIEFLGSRDVELKGLEGTYRLYAVAVL